MTQTGALAQYAAQPFELLRAMENLARTADQNIQSSRQDWTGVGVSIDGINYVIAREQVLEILKKPATTRVPGSQRWMLGLSNVRGTLFPVIDAKLYCGNEPTVIGRDSRIVLINHQPAPVAIVVDEVFGFRRFPATMSKAELHDYDAPFQEYVPGVFVQDEVHWLVLDVLRLIATGGALAIPHYE